MYVHVDVPHALLMLLALPRLVFADFWDADYGLFELHDEYVGNGFFNSFDFAAFDDPTHGRVNYVSEENAIRNNLSYVSSDGFVMRADHKTIVSSKARGRDSVRIQSHAAYSDSITILDASHMPEGCSTWPAFWTISAKGPWPDGGEIDIIEGVNNDMRNLISQHTEPGCTVPSPRVMAGKSISTNCDTKANFNQGCGVRSYNPHSFGTPFNNAGGGWYAMHRTATHGVSVWFWSRKDGLVPDAVKHREHLLQPDESWGLPDAYFPATSCSSNHFDAHHIVFDLTFCGDWAGLDYKTSGCPGDCNDFVNQNPSAFLKAYWEVKSLRVYTPI